jgi:hypothetical protein
MQYGLYETKIIRKSAAFEDQITTNVRAKVIWEKRSF